MYIIGISRFKAILKVDIVIVSTHLALSDISFILFYFLSDTSVGHRVYIAI